MQIGCVEEMLNSFRLMKIQKFFLPDVEWNGTRICEGVRLKAREIEFRIIWM